MEASACSAAAYSSSYTDERHGKHTECKHVKTTVKLVWKAVITEGGFSSTALRTAKQLLEWMGSPGNEIATAAFRKKLMLSEENATLAQIDQCAHGNFNVAMWF